DRIETTRSVQDVVAERDDHQDRSAVEREQRPPRPGRDLLPTLAPHQEDEERDREEERDPRQEKERSQRRLERQRDDDDCDQRDDREPAERRVVGEESPHAVMKARTANAAASTVVPPNHRSRRRASAGA